MQASTLSAPLDPAVAELRPSTFRHWIRDEPGARFRPEAGRYHLYVMAGCPWAHRTLIVRALKGLQATIAVTALHHHLEQPQGWRFAPERPDPLYGAKLLREIYAMADPGYAGRITVPVLWDTRERTIVNNESADIVRMFGQAFDRFAARPQVDLFPVPQREAITRWNARIHAALNAGAYQVGFARSQADYDAAVTAFFAALDEIEAHLGGHRFLAGDQPTEADWRLFPTLIRFEWVYHALFRCNLRRLVDHPHLLGYTRELFQWPGVAETVNEHHIRDGYFRSMRDLNPSGIVPIGPQLDFAAPHGRDRLRAD